MKAASIPRLGLSFTVGVVLSLMLLGSNQAVGQQATAQIAGTVKDTSGALVIGAKVTLKNSSTNSTHTATTDKDGAYLFTLVPIGAYEITVEHAGFRKVCTHWNHTGNQPEREARCRVTRRRRQRSGRGARRR
jgi:hypothetical protein